MKTFYWLLKREYWEHRGGFLWAPLITAGAFVLLNVMAVITGEVLGNRGHSHFNMMFGDWHVSDQLDADSLSQLGAVLDMTLYSVAALVLMVMAIIVFFYCLGSLYDDRRDRSVLFWKSLPISNRATVLSKVASALVVVPIIACVAGVVGGLTLLFVFACTAALHGLNLWELLWTSHPLRDALNLIALIPLYAVWALPTVGWLMLCSAWSRSKPFLWALVLPLAAGVIVTWFGLMGLFNLSAGWFWRHVVGRLLLSLVPGGWVRSSSLEQLNDDSLQHIHGSHAFSNAIGFLDLSRNYSVLASPEIWIGVIAGTAMIGSAIWLRRWRDDG